jgi:hypothetical protein
VKEATIWKWFFLMTRDVQMGRDHKPTETSYACH